MTRSDERGTEGRDDHTEDDDDEQKLDEGEAALVGSPAQMAAAVAYTFCHRLPESSTVCYSPRSALVADLGERPAGELGSNL